MKINIEEVNLRISDVSYWLLKKLNGEKQVSH